MLLGFDDARPARICPKAMCELGKTLVGGPSTRVHLAEGHERALRLAPLAQGTRLARVQMR